MCGRYTFFTDRELQEIDEIIDLVSNDLQLEKMKAGEIFPTNIAPVLFSQDEIVAPRLMTWGFPRPQNKGVIINARSETVREKKLFASSLEQRRCVIPSTGFFEWDKSKKKYLFNVPEGGMLYMAGLFNEFESESRFVILTTDSNDSIRDVHERMPIVLPKNRIKDWIFDFSKVDDILFKDHPGLVKSIAI